MNFRLNIAAWFALSLTGIIALMLFTAHHHLDEELRKDRWDRSHPKYPNWVIHGSFTDEEVHDILGELMKVWLWIGIPAATLSLGAGLLIARRSVRPIRMINSQLAGLSPDSMSCGIHLPESDPEFVNLVAHINESLKRVGSAYEEMAEFASKVAHELRTPLMLLRMRIEQSSSDITPNMQEELQDELARLSRFIERSLLAAKAESGSLEPSPCEVDVSRMLDDIGDGYKLLAADKNLSFSWHIDQDLRARTDPDLLRQVFHNLLGNALRHAHSQVEVTCRLQDGTPVVTMTNDCDPDATRDSGLGLGLRLVRGISSATGTVFQCQPSRDRFTAFLRVESFTKP
jgi:signal transduction histidine kinase